MLAMIVEAIHYRFPGNGGTGIESQLQEEWGEKIAAGVNSLLETDKYVGHIALERNGYSRGVILLLDTEQAQTGE